MTQVTIKVFSKTFIIVQSEKLPGFVGLNLNETEGVLVKKVFFENYLEKFYKFKFIKSIINKLYIKNNLLFIKKNEVK